MAVTVEITDGIRVYENAVKWYADDFEKLHLIDETGKHIAIRAKGDWFSAELGDQRPKLASAA